jgi:RNA polymerase primary sigma factor
MNDRETPNPIARYFGQIARGKLLTHEEEIDLGRRTREGDETARSKLIEKNLRLVGGAYPSGTSSRRAT